MTITVELKHAPNPDISGGYWDDANPTANCTSLPIEKIEDATAVCRAYINATGLGGGNWTGGTVSVDGIPVARVSYNGRIWNMDGTPYQMGGAS
jgi:hypothetical protein